MAKLIKIQFLFFLLEFSGSVASAQVRSYAPELFPDDVSGAVCGFSSDGKTIYFVREDTTQKKLFLFEAGWDGLKWSGAQCLPFSGKHNDYGGRLTPDGKTFYFASDRPGASDNTRDVWNIWKVSKSTPGWKEPEPLSEISNDGDECCPVPFTKGDILYSGTSGKSQWQMLETGNESALPEPINYGSGWQWPSYYDPVTATLFFNSMKRTDSKGMDDIYIARFKDGAWKDARNLGEKINTSVYEDGAILSPDRKVLIFCRHDTGSTPSRVLCIDVEAVLPDFIQTKKKER